MKHILLVLLFTIITGCNEMNTQHNSQDANIAYYFQQKNTSMANAIYNENIEEISRLVKQEGYNLNSRDRVEHGVWTYEYTFLNYAVIKQKIKSIQALIDLGADVNQLLLINGNASSNLNLACEQGNIAIIKLLLNHHIQINKTLVQSPLIDFMLNNDFDKSVFDLLVENGANVNHPEYFSGDTPLVTAYSTVDHKAVDYLLEKGANPLQVDTNGNSLASIIQRDINDQIHLEVANHYKQILVNKHNVKFPVNVSYRKGIMERIKRYEKTTPEERAILGSDEIERIKQMRESLTTGIYNGVKID